MPNVEENNTEEEFVVEDAEEETSTHLTEELSPEKNELRDDTDDEIEDDLKSHDAVDQPSQISVSPSQELFAKYVRLENNMKTLKEKYDRLQNEKSVLDKIVRSKDVILTKTTLENESHVEQIGKIKDSLRMKENQIKNLKAEKKALEEISNFPTKKKVGSDNKNRTNIVLPEESLDRIVALENEVKLKNVCIGTLESEIHTLKAMMNKKNQAIEKLEESLKSGEFKRDKAYEIESKNADLVIQLEKAQKEIRTLQEISRMKTKTIEKLNEEIETLRTEEEMYKDQQRKGLQTSKEMERLKMELKVAKRSIEKKEKEMDKIVNERDTIPLKSLEGDKRFLQSQLKTYLEKISIHERTIKIQDKKIESYQQRLSNITQALKETKLDKVLRIPKSSNNSVAASLEFNEDESASKEQSEIMTTNEDQSDFVAEELYDLLQRDVEELRKLSFERDISLSEKDTVIEALEKKVDIMEKSKVSDSKAYKQKIQDLQEKIDEMHKKMAVNEEQFKQQEKQWKKEALIVKKKLHQTRGIVKK